MKVFVVSLLLSACDASEQATISHVEVHSDAQLDEMIDASEPVSDPTQMVETDTEVVDPLSDFASLCRNANAIGIGRISSQLAFELNELIFTRSMIEYSQILKGMPSIQIDLPGGEFEGKSRYVADGIRLQESGGRQMLVFLASGIFKALSVSDDDFVSLGGGVIAPVSDVITWSAE